jgi:hypothetical protein
MTFLAYSSCRAVRWVSDENDHQEDGRDSGALFGRTVTFKVKKHYCDRRWFIAMSFQGIVLKSNNPQQ